MWTWRLGFASKPSAVDTRDGTGAPAPPNAHERTGSASGSAPLGPAWLVAVMLLACARAAPAAREPEPMRSPSLDYTQPLRSASDGEIMGANEQSPSDTLAAGATNAHPGAGWDVHDGRLELDREWTPMASPHYERACAAPLGAPVTPDEQEARLALARALWKADRDRMKLTEFSLSDDAGDWLDCTQ
jgi:hypothetical protein